ncbi:MAG: DUF3783 domain-containing protein, partial [Polyangia bacterium]|nr:DUF3783 domain-containing protein [Polyangia bacterium]
SGLTGRQIPAIIDSWPETGLWRPIWASTTPTNLGLGLRTLLRELLAEQRAMETRLSRADPGKKKGDPSSP